MCSLALKKDDEPVASVCDLDKLLLDDDDLVFNEYLDYNLDGTKLRSDDKYAGFDNNTGDTWIYPTNYPMRKYQFEIIKAALFRNTLVVLPTGLGKTFLAAVVMYNFYRWYPKGKIIFMAPTKPLVAQQIEACYNIVGIAKEETAEITGRQAKKSRIDLWKCKRVFFATPQAVASDIICPDFPINEIRMLIFDEAHKAKGKYAYNEVIQAIMSHNKLFRVLALSATPGRSLVDVCDIVKNLLISHIEVRAENSPDVAPYTFKKKFETVVVRLDEQLRQVKDDLIDIIDPYVRNLINFDVITGTTSSLSRGWLIMQQKRFEADCVNQRHPNHSAVMSDFACAVSLFHALELLEYHGLQIFLNFFQDNTKNYLQRDFKLMNLIKNIRETVGANPLLVSDSTMPNGVIPDMPNNLDFGHPKFEILRKHIITHFETNKDSRAIIFCEYRESVFCVHKMLLQHRPLLKPEYFIGHGNAGSGQKNVTQKQQIATMDNFRKGVTNVLIATSVAEEGIDVGEIDLIICFEVNNKNPTRFVQRMGRTGRRRDGQVLILVTEGKEEANLKNVVANKDSTNRKILQSPEIKNILYESPRLVPTEFNPKCLESFIKVSDGEQGNKKKRKSNNDQEDELMGAAVKSHQQKHGNQKSTRTKCKKTKDTQDVRDYFKPITHVLDKEDEAIFENTRLKPKTLSASINYDDSYIPELENSATDNTTSQACPSKQKNDTEHLLSNLQCVKKYLISNKLKPSKNIGTSHKNISAHEFKELVMHKASTNFNFEILQKNLRIQIDSNIIKMCESVHVEMPTKFQNIFKSTNEDCTVQMEMLEKDFIDDQTENDIKVYEKSTIFQQNNDSQIDIEENISQPLFIFIENESKYHSQIVEKSIIETTEKPRFNEKSLFKNDHAEIKSPFKRTHSFESPKISRKKSSKKVATPIQDSPLVRAFQKSFEKQRNKIAVANALAYFGLKDVLDLFDEEDENVEIIEASFQVADSPILLKPTKQKSIMKKAPQPSSPYSSSKIVKVNNISDMFLDDAFEDTLPNLETQHTISQIMKIVNERHPTKPTTTPAKKSIDIGTIDDIFADDIFDETINECDKNIGDVMPSFSPDVILPSQNYSLDTVLKNKQSIAKNAPLEVLTNTHKGNVVTSVPKVNTTALVEKESTRLSPMKQFIMVSDNLNNLEDSPPLSSSSQKENELTVKKGLAVCDTPKNSKKSPALIQPEATSPSILNKKVNLSKLRRGLHQVNTLPHTSKNHAPAFITHSEQIQDLNARSAGCNKVDLSCFENKPANKNVVFEESLINQPVSYTKRRVIYDSSSEEDSDDGDFIKPLNKKASAIENQKRQTLSKQKKRRKMCSFVIEECEVSGDEIDEDDSDDHEMLNSIICLDEDAAEDHPDVDMHAKYLQSTRSPCRKQAYRMERPLKPMNISDIFSQVVVPDPTDVYKECSFVVSDDEAAENITCYEEDPLEKAERLLRQQRKARRREMGMPNRKKIKFK